MPAAVATPFPPLKPTNGENTCPRTATAPSAAAHPPPRAAQGPNRPTGTAPFAPPISATGIAYLHPAIRHPLVAPRLLRPCSPRPAPRPSLPASPLGGKQSRL